MDGPAPRSSKAPLIVGGVAVALLLLALVAIRLYHRALGPLPVTGADRLAMVTAAELGFAAPASETFEKRRLFGASRVRYHATGIGDGGKGSIEETFTVHRTPAGADTAVKAMVAAGTRAFRLAAKPGSTIDRRPLDWPWASEVSWWEMRTDGRMVGVFVVLRSGAANHLLTVNGAPLEPDQVEPLLRAKWSP